MSGSLCIPCLRTIIATADSLAGLTYEGPEPEAAVGFKCAGCGDTFPTDEAYESEARAIFYEAKYNDEVVVSERRLESALRWAGQLGHTEALAEFLSDVAHTLMVERDESRAVRKVLRTQRDTWRRSYFELTEARRRPAGCCGDPADCSTPCLP
jgi:hypothetical protein